MGRLVTATVRDDLSIQLPDEMAGHLHLHEGEQVSIEEKGPFLLIRPARPDRDPMQEFSDAVRELRMQVREAGGISEAEIEDAIRRVRAEDANRGS